MGAAQSQLTVDVVDDDSDVLLSLRFLLEVEGFRVRTFTSGISLLAPCIRNQAHCFIIDYRMPDMNGLELAGLLKAKGISTPVVLVTGAYDDTLHSKAAAQGVNHVLTKPYIEENLVTHVRRAIMEAQS